MPIAIPVICFHSVTVLVRPPTTHSLCCKYIHPGRSPSDHAEVEMRTDVYHLNRFIIYWSASRADTEWDRRSRVGPRGWRWVGWTNSGPISRLNWFHWRGPRFLCMRPCLCIELITGKWGNKIGCQRSGAPPPSTSRRSVRLNRKIIISIGSIAARATRPTTGSHSGSAPIPLH